jgi:predicted O-methyltransferase YrrM
MAKFKVPHNWGLCFDGNGGAFCDALDAALESHSGVFRYVEIGIGYGGGLRAVDEYLSQTGADYDLQGVDIATCNGEAANSAFYPHPERTRISLIGASQFLATYARCDFKADFVFIDGCHGAKCVEADFLGAEKIIRVGGVVAFHDTDPGCQDLHMQPHCGTGIRAREAVQKLGLLDNSRPGWVKLDETTGDKSRGGHGCLFVKRV